MSNYVIVLGYGWSGSSAVVDLLKEYEDAMAPDVEFRLIKDPYGLIDLKNSLVYRWDPLNSDIAIKDFLWLIDHLNYSQSCFSLKAGLGYEKSIGDQFIAATNEFLEKVIDFEYESRWWFFDFKKDKLNFLRRKIERRLKVHRKADWRTYFARPTEEEFDKYAKEYINRIFSSYSEYRTIVLDQAVPTQMYPCAFDYFENVKIIIVDRDPRDIYVDLIYGNNLIGKELRRSRNPEVYVKWHNAFRKRVGLEENYKEKVLRIRFEELVLQYNETVSKIESFLDINKKSHIRSFKYFNPEKSKDNVGMWKRYEGKSEIEYIHRNI